MRRNYYEEQRSSQSDRSSNNKMKKYSQSNSDKHSNKHSNKYKKNKQELSQNQQQKSIDQHQFYQKETKNQSNKKKSHHKSKQQKISSAVILNCLYAYIKKVKVLPTILVQHLEKRQKKYDSLDQLIYYPFSPKDLNFKVKTKYGKKGVRDLIEYLQKLQSKQSDGSVKEVDVQWSHELHQAASKRVNAIQKGNAAIQSLDTGQLVGQYGIWQLPLCEIIVYGFIDPKQILIEAFLEDDSSEKNNRSQFFNEGGKYVGIDMGFHEQYQVVTVIIFAGGINKSGDNKSKKRGDYIARRQSDRECQCRLM